jgi:IS605 OrfB family transposase
MDVTKTLKIQIKPTVEQIELLKKTAEVYRNACNFVSEKAFKFKLKSKFDMQRLYYHDVRDSFGLMSQMAISVFGTVAAKYKTKAKQDKQKKKFEKANKSKKKPNSDKAIQFKVPEYDLVYNKDYSINKQHFSVSVLNSDKRIKVAYISKPFDEYFESLFNKDKRYHFGTAKYKQITIGKKTKHYLFIPITYKVADTVIDESTNVIGIDRGLNFTAVAYNSDKHTDYYNGKQLKQKRAKFKALRTQLQTKHTPSSRRRLKLIGKRENRWMRDVNHCVSKALIQNAKPSSLFVLEDLSNVRSATESVKRKDRYVQVSWAYYDLEMKLKYKAERDGHCVIKVSPEYSSQRCPICGHVHHLNRNKRKHIFMCKHCGYRSNDDRIGAMNLHYLGEVYKTADAEGRKHVCDLGLLSTSPKCNVTFDSKPKAKRRKKKGAVAQAAVTGQLQTNSLQGVGS